MKRFILFSFLTFFILSLGIAQNPIDEKKVPAPVLKVFLKKNGKATDKEWTKQMVGKQEVYTVTYMLGEKRMENSYDKSGKWIKGKTYYEEMKELPEKANEYLRKEFGSYKFKEAFFYQDATKEKHITVFMTRKIKGMEEPAVWEIWFSNLGIHITTFEPNIPDANPGSDLPPDEKFDRKVDKTVDVTAEPAAEETIDKKELPSITLNYLKANYNNEWLYKEILIRETPDMGTVYYVVMKRQGFTETWEHYFDPIGNLIKRTRLDQEE
jgi:hypothetical protein